MKTQSKSKTETRAVVTEKKQETPPARWRKWLPLLDVIVFLALVLAAWPLRWDSTQGDLWGDEADYAVASTKGFQAHRFDKTDDPQRPDALIVSRHFHPPLTVYAVGLASRWGAEDRILRVPFVVAGCLTVGLVYLCGLPLFGNRRELALGCALIVLITPLHIRTSSHAIPWSLITLNLIGLLWTLLKYSETRRAVWLGGTMVTLGTLFVLSEMLYPVLVILGVLAPVLLWKDFRDTAQRKRILVAMAVGAAVSLAMAIALWPAGLGGGSLTMLQHYMGVADKSIPVKVGATTYNPTPKWAYLYWYRTDYLPYFAFYAGSLIAIPLLIVFRKFRREMGILFIVTALLLAVAHRAHILGPEYLVHCLPLLTLMSGLAWLCVSLLWRPLGFVGAALVVAYLLRWQPNQEQRDLRERAMIPRWPAAAQFLKTRWKPGDRLILGPQTGAVGRWYLQRGVNIPASDAQIQPFPPSRPKPELVRGLVTGQYRFVVVSSAFMGNPPITPEIQQIIKTWPVVYKSDERIKRASRLIIYEVPPEVSPQNPLPMPQIKSGKPVLEAPDTQQGE